MNFTGVPFREIPLKAQPGGKEPSSTWWAPESPGRERSWHQPLGGLLAPRDHPSPATPEASRWWKAALTGPSRGRLGLQQHPQGGGVVPSPFRAWTQNQGQEVDTRPMVQVTGSLASHTYLLPESQRQLVN